MQIAFCDRKKHSNRPIVEGTEGEGISIMDFAVVLVVSNTVMTLFIYIVVTKIWRD